MKLKIQFTADTGSQAVRILNRLTHDMDGKRLASGQSYLLVNDKAKAVGMANVETPPRTQAQHAAALMQPVIDSLGAYGSVKRLIDKFEAMAGVRPHYASWMRWLHVDPGQRMQPAVGTALGIRAAFDALQMEAMTEEAKRQVEKALKP